MKRTTPDTSALGTRFARGLPTTPRPPKRGATFFDTRGAVPRPDGGMYLLAPKGYGFDKLGNLRNLRRIAQAGA